MPCESYGYGDSEARAQAATKVACELAEHIEKNSKVQLLSIQSISLETKKWVIAHRELDQIRIEAEAKADYQRQLKRMALNKLSAEEKKLLNIWEQ